MPEDLPFQWLERHEAGEPLTAIAEGSGFTPRTIKDRIAGARERRMEAQARETLLLNVLGGHHADLCGAVQELQATLVCPPDLSSLGDYQRLRDSTIARRGLKMHFSAERKNSPVKKLWQRRGDRWEEACLAFTDASQHLEQQATQELGDLGESVAWVLVRRAVGWNVATEGYPALAKLQAATRERTLATAEQWPQYEELRSRGQALVKLRDKVAEQLESIALKRVLPGRCQLCPF